MQTQELLKLFRDHQGKSLLFQYREGELVGANYHITEVKNITVDAVDCGGRVDFWKETVVQLWESPNERGKTDYMSVYKALAILKRVDRMKPMDPDAEVKFEYSNSNFHTAQLFVSGYELSEGKLLLRLAVEKTDCKAKEECGVPVEAGVTAECKPGTGCC